MSSEKSLTPQIRFKGFTEAWEQRKLGELGQTYNGLTGKNKDDFGHGRAQYITYMNVFSNPICDLALTEKIEVDQKQNEVEIGDVFFTTSSETPEEVGMSSVLTEKQGITYLNSFCFGYRPLKKIDLNYLAYMLRSNTFRKNITFLAQGISRYNISKTKVMDVSMHLPTTKEQYMVGTFFKNLDSLITLHQRKLDALKKIKSALLEKMFPKDGSNIPEIRFAGYTETWEQRKLSDVAEIIGGGTPDTNNPSYWDGDIDWYSPAELGEQIYTTGSRRRITKEGYKNSSAKLLPANKTILFTSRAGIGTTAILCRSACTNQGFQSLVISDNTDLYFIYSMSSRIKDFAISKASGSTFLEISGKQLATMSLFLPQLNEQRKIGRYFKSLDNLITLHQRKLDALKKIKSALLEKMFV